MTLQQMIDNVTDAMAVPDFGGITLFLALAGLGISTATAIIVIAITHPSIAFPIIIGLLIGRVIYAAIKGK